jgi:hypothetical protein
MGDQAQQICWHYLENTPPPEKIAKEKKKNNKEFETELGECEL